jgi:hypothetical protein
MSEPSAPPSPLEVRTPPLPPVADAAAAPAAGPALPALPCLPCPALPCRRLRRLPPLLPSPLLGQWVTFKSPVSMVASPLRTAMLTLTDGFRPHSRPQPPRRLALRAWSPRPAAQPQPQHLPAREPRDLSWPDRWCACRFRVQPLRSRACSSPITIHCSVIEL